MSNALEIRKSTLPMSKELEAVMEQIRENIAAVGQFRIPRIKATSSGLEISEDIEPTKEIEGVLIYPKKTKAYYSKAYKQGEKLPPDCHSNDWKVPAPDVAKPQNATCKDCPQNQFGSNNMESGKACRDMRPLYFLEVIKNDAGGDTLSPIPQMLLVTPTSLKSFDQYLTMLTQKLKHFRGVVTKVKWEKKDAKATYGLLSFSIAKDITKEMKADAEGLYQMWAGVMDAQILDEAPIEETVAAPIVEGKGGDF